jgi:hypothetical protein
MAVLKPSTIAESATLEGSLVGFPMRWRAASDLFRTARSSDTIVSMFQLGSLSQTVGGGSC